MSRSTRFRTATFLVTATLFFTVRSSYGEDQQQPLIDILKSDASTTQRAEACRKLKLVGGAAAVPALATLLNHKDLAHEARIALESMPCSEASAALRKALGETTGAIRAGIIDSIGERRDVESVAILAKLLNDSDLQVSASAALALGKIGSTEAARLLNGAYDLATQDRKAIIGDGLVRCADELLAAGKRDKAAMIYCDLVKATQPASVRAAALRGIIQSAGDKLPDKVREFLASDDAMIREAAAVALPDLSVDEFRAVAVDTDKLPIESQIALVTAMRFRGDSSFTPLVVQAAKSDNVSLARAAISALGTVAGDAGVDILLPLTYDDELSQTAWHSLEVLRGKDVNAKLAGALQKPTSPNHRARIIDVLQERSAHKVVSAIIPHVIDRNEEVKRYAIEAIQVLATPSDAANITSLMLKTPKGRNRDELEKAVMLAVRQLPEPDSRTDAVLAAVNLGSPDQKISILPLLGRVGGPRALEEIQSALRTGEGDMYAAGVRAISNWPNASVSDQLLNLARNASQQSHRIWALRALIRVITLPSDDISDVKKLAVLKQAMSLARRDEERVLVLQRASAVRSLDTLKFLLPFLDQSAFAQEACQSVVKLAHHKELREPNKADFKLALKKVLKVSRDDDTVNRAKRYLRGQ